METAALSRTSLPQPKGLLLARSRLQDELQEALGHRKLVLVCAPAGYGKTAVLAQALAALPPDRAVAWVSLHEDDDLQSLLASLLAALDPFDLPWRVSPEALPAMVLREGGFAGVATILANTLQEADAAHGVIALDDLHYVGDPDVFEFLDRLLDVMPESWTMALASRTEPPLRIARRYLLGEVAEFRQAQLQFGPHEVKALLEAGHLPAPPDRVSELLERTGGWAVGLNVELRSLQHPGSERGARRHLHDYFMQEVLQRLPRPLQEFLLRCSVLHELTPARCARVSGQPYAERHLQELAKRDLFVVTLEGDDLSLRIHDLFRDFLESVFAREHPKEHLEVLRLAAADEPDLVLRVGYLLRAGAPDEAARELMRESVPLIHAGAGARLLRMFEQFPEPQRSESAELLFVRGLMAWNAMDYASTHAAMLGAMVAFERAGQWQQAVQARGIAAIGLYLSGQLGEAFGLWDDAPRIEMNRVTEAVAALLAVMHSAQYGPHDATPRHMARLVSLIPVIRSENWTSFFRVHYAYMGRVGMRTPMTALVDSMERAAGEAHPELALLALRTRAWLALWAGDMLAVRDLSAQIASEAQWFGNPPSVAMPNQLLKAIEHLLCGRWSESLLLLKEIADAAGRNPGRRSRLMYVHFLGGWAAAAEDWATARWALAEADAAKTPLEWRFIPVQHATLQAELALHDGDAARAVALLQPLTERALDCDTYGLNDRLRVALARAHVQRAQTTAAWSCIAPALQQALDEKEPLGLLMCGPAALQELASARWPMAASEPALAYLRDCAVQARELRGGGGVPAALPDTLGKAGLTEREQQVLHLMALGQSNKLIARALDLSPHTVKRHVARIFDKLGETSRNQAAAWYWAHGGAR